MQKSTCSSCRLLFRSRFHRRLIELQNCRRKSHHKSPAYEEAQHQPQLQRQPLSQPLPRPGESWYWQTTPPTRQNLAAASHFFKHNIPTRIWTGEGWRNRQNESQELPEVIFLGRSNVGKSSVINALTSTDINRVSSVPGATKAMAAWTLAARTPEGGAIRGWDGDVSPKLTLVDMPGYGHGSQTEWGNAIAEYLAKRRNIRRAFVLIDVLHGVMARDGDIVKILTSHAIPYQVVATKCDRFANSRDAQHEAQLALTKIRAEAGLDKDDSLGLGEIITTGSLDGMTTKDSLKIVTKKAAFGIPNLQWAVLRAAGLDQYAMQKAQSHGVLKKIPAEQPVLSIEAGNVRDTVEEEDSAQEDIRGEDSIHEDSKQDHSAPNSSVNPTSTSTSESGISVEDFLREILNAGPQKSSHTKHDRGQDSKGARIFPSLLTPDGNPSSSSSTNGRRRSSGSTPNSLLSDWFSEAERNSPAARPSYSTAGNKRSPETSPASTTRDQSPIDRKKAYQGRDAFGNISRSTSTTRSPSGSQVTVPGKGVMRGMDALDAMSSLDPRSAARSKSNSNTRHQQFGKSKARGGNQRSPRGRAMADRDYDAQYKGQSSPAPAVAGKGVTRGADAFQAMLGNDSAAKGSQKRTRTQRRK